jgi:Ca2+-binding RTX toxin-like protein
MSKLYIATKDVEILGVYNTSYDHLYFVYDPDDNPNNRNELVIRGGQGTRTPEDWNTNPWTFGLIEMQIGEEINRSRDALNGDTIYDRHYRMLSINGLQTENVWTVMLEHAKEIRSEHYTYSLHWDGTEVDTAQNSNSVVASLLYAVGAGSTFGYLPNNPGADYPGLENGLLSAPSGGYTIDGYKYVLGNSSNNTLTGSSSGTKYVLDGGYGNDTLTGNSQNDKIWGGDGVDTIYGNNGNDQIIAGRGNDVLYGGSGDDVILGESGSDIIDGGGGDDYLAGGFEQDIYIWDYGYTGHVIIKDQGGGDIIKLVGMTVDDLHGQYDTRDGGTIFGPNGYIYIPKLKTDGNAPVYFQNPDTTLVAIKSIFDENDPPAPPPPFPPLPFGPPGGPGGEGVNGLAPWMPAVGDGMDQGQDASYPRLDGSPLVIDMDNDGVELTDATVNPVYWDVDNDGFRDASAWVSPDDALLVMDWNGNGQIDNHSELFGTKTVDGFTILSELDSNTDGVIDSNDDLFDELQIWQDANQDGYSQESELQSLTAAGIVSINLSATPAYYQIAGNDVTHESTVTMSDTSTRDIIDAWFKYDDMNTVYSGSWVPDIRVLELPELRGYGEIKSLSIAMSMDETLLDKVTILADMDLEDVLDSTNDFDGKFREMIYRWGDTENLSLGMARNDYDQRKTDFLDELSGRDYRHGIENGLGVNYQRGYLMETWQLALNELEARFLAQTVFKPLFDGDLQYDPVTDLLTGATGISSTGLDDIVDMIANSDDKTYSWTLVTRVVEAVLGIDNLSGGDYDLLDDAIQLDTSHSLDSIYDAITLGVANVTEDTSSHAGTLIGTGSDDLLSGLDMNDTMDGGYGDDRLYGGTGNDTYIGGHGDDYLVELSGGGNDTYVYNAGRDYIEESGSGGGSDTLEFVSGIVSGDICIERVNHVDHSSNNIWGQADLVVNVAGLGSVTILDQYNSYNYYGNVISLESILFADTSTIDLTHLDDFVNGTNGNDTMVGADRAYYLNDRMDAGDGNDTLSGGLGHNYLAGGWGNDTYIYGGGLDTIAETYSTDQIFFDNTYDPNLFTVSFDALQSPYDVTTQDLNILYDGELKVIIKGGIGYGEGSYVEQIVVDGVQTINISSFDFDQHGTSSNDTMYGIETYALENNTLYGHDGDDSIQARAGNDYVDGGNGADYVYGNDGNDTLLGGAGADYVDGGSGNDELIGGSGNDTMYAGSGDDILRGGDGADTLNGGNNADTFVFEADSAFNNIDTVTDFYTWQSDKLDISDLLTGYTPGTSDINDFVSLGTFGSDMILYVDRDGTGGTYSSQQIATLSYTSGLVVDDLLNNGNLIAA